MGGYEIRKGVPIVRPKRTGMTHTIRAMDVGDSIVVPGSQMSSVHACAAQAGAKVTTSKNDDGTVTVWRVDSSVAPSKNIFGEPSQSAPSATVKPASDLKPTAGTGWPVPPGYPKIERTVADPAMGLAAGYYIQEDPYGPQLWREGEPPTPTIESAPAPKPKITIFE